jgi:hypothetical protein
LPNHLGCHARESAHPVTAELSAAALVGEFGDHWIIRFRG